MAEGAPLIHETDPRGRPRKDNLVPVPWRFVAGDVEKAREKAAFIAEDSFDTQLIQQTCMGTAGCIAEFDLQNNLIMHTKTQIPFLAQNDFNQALKAMGLKGKKLAGHRADPGRFLRNGARHPWLRVHRHPSGLQDRPAR